MSPFEDLERQIEQQRTRENVTLIEKRQLLLEVEEFINSPDYQSLSPDERNRVQLARKDLLMLRSAARIGRGIHTAGCACTAYLELHFLRSSSRAGSRAQPGCRTADGDG